MAMLDKGLIIKRTDKPGQKFLVLDHEDRKLVVVELGDKNVVMKGTLETVPYSRSNMSVTGIVRSNLKPILDAEREPVTDDTPEPPVEAKPENVVAVEAEVVLPEELEGDDEKEKDNSEDAGGAHFPWS